MSIPIVTGLGAGREKILASRALQDKAVSPAVSERLHKTFGAPLTPDQAVAQVIADVRERGDTAVLDWTRRLDGVALARVSVGPEEIRTAYEETPSSVREALSLSAQRIRAFHEKQKPKSWLEWDAGGALGQRITPLSRVGVYVPGGTAPYPSSLLMGAIPAQVAGVGQVEIATPPGRDGRVAPVILAAAHVAGISRVFAMGGAQGIAALAFGTETVPRVDKIVGPGGLFVTLAKRQVFGLVGIDGLYGPTETLLIADDSANAAWVAADLLAQAEHDELATSLLITVSPRLAEEVQREIARQLPALVRRNIIERSFEGQGALIVVATLGEAIELANAYAPEHLCLILREPWSWVGEVKNAGGIFVGEWTNEALGDYIIGPSHVMPTAGTARFSSALNVNDFVKITSIFSLGSRRVQELGGPAEILAQSEGLTAHASAIRQRMTNDQGGKA